MIEGASPPPCRAKTRTVSQRGGAFCRATCECSSHIQHPPSPPLLPSPPGPTAPERGEKRRARRAIVGRRRKRGNEARGPARLSYYFLSGYPLVITLDASRFSVASWHRYLRDSRRSLNWRNAIEEHTYKIPSVLLRKNNRQLSSQGGSLLDANVQG